MARAPDTGPLAPEATSPRHASTSAGRTSSPTRGKTTNQPANASAGKETHAKHAPPSKGGSSKNSKGGAWSSAAEVNKLKQGFTRQARHGAHDPTAASAPTPTYDDKYRDLYECAQRDYYLREDGYQRAMTDVEHRTLMKWLEGKIHLNAPPRFLTETHVAAEQDAFLAYFRSSLGHRLYGRLPTGFLLPNSSPKWHFCSSLLLEANSTEVKARVKDLVYAASRIECSARSPIVEFIFVRPEDRDKWAGTTFNIGRGEIKLEAQETPRAAVKSKGYSTSAQTLLYQVHVIGMGGTDPGDIRAWIAAATSTTIAAITASEPTGSNLFGPHRWIITFDSVECPVELQRKRLIRVTTAGVQTLVYLHHPRVSNCLPCTSCLSIRHLRKDCETKNPENNVAHHTIDVQCEPSAHPVLMPSAGGWNKTTNKLRESTAPMLTQRLRSEKQKQAAALRESRALAKAAAAAAQARNDELQRRKQKEASARYKAKAAVTAELKQWCKNRSQRSTTGKADDTTTNAGTDTSTSKDDAKSASVVDNSSTSKDNDDTPTKASGTPTNVVVDTPTREEDSTPSSEEVDNEATSPDEGTSSSSDDEQRASSQQGTSPTPTSDEAELEDTLMEPADRLDDTLHINELEHCGTQEDGADSEGEGAMSDGGEVPIPAALAATFEHEVTPNSTHLNSQAYPVPQVRIPDVSFLHTAQEARRAADLHARTMMQSRARKSPVNASPAVATAATTESTIRRRENPRAIKHWAKEHHSTVPDIALVDEQGDGVDKAIGKWIAECALELAELVKSLPHPVEFLKAMRLKLLINFGHAISSETQLTVIRQYATDNKLSPHIRELCSKWATVATAKRGKNRWMLTDSIQRWNRVIKYDNQLLSATVVQQVHTDEWGVLNAICLLLPNLAPADTATGVTMPQTKSSLYHNSEAVRKAIDHVLRKPADWQPILDLIRSERSGPPSRH